MSTDIRLAFAHPEERAEATASTDPRDRISLRDYLAEAEIGAFQAERGHRQRLLFNVVVELRPYTGPIDDDVDRILSYDRLIEAIQAELDAERLNLLETLAERVADRILTQPQAMRAFVRVEKLDRGPFALGVEIVRARAAAPLREVQADGAATALHPLVVVFDNALIDAPEIAVRIDALLARGLPVVICVGLPPVLPPQVDNRAAQRRIDLLAIEQNAWRLAARDKRCVVVSSRTEIDWAMRQRQLVVWAPSKLILDMPDAPLGQAHDGAGLALWLAELLAAEAVLAPAGAVQSAGSRVRVETFVD